MRAVTVVAMSVVAVFSLACGGGGATVAAPYSDMKLPIGDGSVLYSDGTSTTVTYSSGTATSGLATGYSDAVKAWGCTEKYPMVESAGTYAWSCDKDGKTYSLAVAEGGGMVAVTLSSY